MGLIKAAIGSLGGTLADQWKEFFYCDALDNDTLMVKGQKRTSSRSSNTKGEDNIITNGSGIAVADGQCMIIVDQGKVVELCAEPGEFTFDDSSEPSIFAGSLGESIKGVFTTMLGRFTYGGDTGKDQRIYYINTKEILDNKFGTPTPIPFRVVDRNIGLDIDVSVRCSGVYSYKITNPLLFYKNVCGNVSSSYAREEIDTMLKKEFITALQPAMGKLSQMQLRPSDLPMHAEDLADAMNDNLTEKWEEMRGIKVWSVALNPISLPEEDEELIKNAQRTAIMRDPTMAAATLVGAQADAMKAAASNDAGAMTGFMGMGMAQNAGGMNAQGLFAMGQQNQPQSAPAPVAQKPGSWKCACGNTAEANFCTNCGAKKPDTSWKCACGSVNNGNFCPICGSKKPEAAKSYRCSQCGWEPADPKAPPKFCPMCGHRFDENDAR